MSKAPHILLIRADASPRMGTGHVMRCLALAQWAARAGIETRIIGRFGVPWVAERLRKEGISFTALDGEAAAAENPDALLMQLGRAAPDAWAVLDGYHFGLDCQKAVREAGFKLLLIDDYAHLPEYSCDILLNQNTEAERIPYVGDIGKKLLGPGYAMLRPEFAAARKRAEERTVPDHAGKLLLSLGGGDFSGHLERIAASLTLPELAGCVLRVIAGAMRHELIRELLHDCPATVEILTQVDDMPSLLLDTDLCITAGGSTCWELCCLGVPFLAVQTAENQRHVISGLLRLEIAPLLSMDRLGKCLRSRKSRESSRVRGFSLVDGLGASKIMAALLCAASGVGDAGRTRSRG